MTAVKLRENAPARQAVRLRGWSLLTFALTAGLACAAPISTQRSPYHLRIVEVRNASDGYQVLTIEPTPDQHLGAATTFTGVLRPGQVKLLYLYHGFQYAFRVFDEPTGDQRALGIYEVDRDMGLSFSGDSLVSDVRLTAQLGDPSFADSLQAADPFGLRTGGFIEPDTARGQLGEREREEERRRGIRP